MPAPRSPVDLGGRTPGSTSGRRPRDRRGRGLRGPRCLPGPLTPRGTPARRSPQAEFDAWVRLAADRLRRHAGAELAGVQIAVEETALLPDDWDREVPLCTHMAADRRHPARVVVYRLPVSDRVRGRVETASLVLDLLVEELADLVGVHPDELDPRAR